MITTLDLAASSSDPVARRTLHSLSLSVAKSKRIVVVTGAGISCSCGIPVRWQSHAFASIGIVILIYTRRTSALQMVSTHS
jgi:NAD-dependent SIR2 family protein deacetylase